MMSSSKRKRTTFTEEQRGLLESYYKDGLKSTKKENRGKLEEIAAELHLDYKNVKVRKPVVRPSQVMKEFFRKTAFCFC